MIQTGNGRGSVAPVPPRPTAELTSQQRSQRIDALVNQINAVTVQLNTLTKAYGLLETANQKAQAQVQALEDDRAFWQSRSFLSRLSWVMTGR